MIRGPFSSAPALRTPAMNPVEPPADVRRTPNTRCVAMLKKLVILGVVGFVAVAAFRGTKIGSYIRSEVCSMRDQAESYIPPEQEIGRLRNEIKSLDKDVLTVVSQLAKEKVEIDDLKEKTETQKAKLAKDRERIDKRAEAIKSATEYVVFGERRLSVAAAKSELEADVKRHAANQDALTSLVKTIAKRQEIKASLEQQLETLKNQKAELAAAVDGLEAELNALKLQQMESKYQTDDSRLSKIKEDIRALKMKMDIEREKNKLMPAALDPPSASSSKSVDDIMAPLKKPAGDARAPTVE